MTTPPLWRDSVERRLEELLEGQRELVAMIRASHPEIWKDAEPVKKRRPRVDPSLQRLRVRKRDLQQS